MKIQSILFLILPFCFLAVSAQDDYWQQEVNYTIKVKLNDVKHELSAYQEFEYINNSPNTLDKIYIHLWRNAYKNDKTEFAKQALRNNDDKFYFSDDSKRGFIDSLDFKVDGKKCAFELDKKYEDVGILYLETPLKPKQKIVVSTPFRVKIPDSFSRLGHVGTSYQITQWFPKPAVYDQTGWHPYSYLDMGEFYSEFGSFDVSITLPKNYVVGATGVLQNEEELNWLTQKASEAKNITYFDTANSFPASSQEWKTIQYKQDKIHDFAWFADKRFNVLKSEVKLPHTGKKVTTWTMFTNAEAKLWKKSINYIDSAVYYYSLWNGDYPYEHVTALEGALSAGGGMEYPMVTIIGSSGSAISLDQVIAHEVGHNWFQGILGTNEREYAWMDEGINSFNEMRYMNRFYSPSQILNDVIPARLTKMVDLEYIHKLTMNKYSYLMAAKLGMDQPIELNSKLYSNYNYGSIVYMKTAYVFEYLYQYFGQEKFDKIMMTYYERWKFKHPQPKDIKAIFEEISGEDLTWFFDEILTTNRKIDFKLGKIFRDEKSTEVVIDNTTGVMAPAIVYAFDKDDQLLDQKWSEPFVTSEVVKFDRTDIAYFEINSEEFIPEIRIYTRI